MSFEKYPSGEIEKKWRQKWEEEKLYEVDFSSEKEKYYSLVMFPYPSGDKLHVGHWYNFGPADSWARYQRMQGKNVFTPMGFDAFGLPAENYAVKTGVHPNDSTKKNVETMIEQLKRMGCMYDWSKMVNTSQPEYYRWTQWLFLELYKHGLSERREAPVNWCPSCQTVLANEQVKEGKCDRCDSEITKRDLTQWFWKISDYSERLLNHKDVDWPEKTILMQQNWIGKSFGVDIDFPLADDPERKLTAYTTRIDTLYSVTFVVVAPEHPIVDEFTRGTEYETEVENVRREINMQSLIERTSEGGKDKLGCFLGKYALNPATGEKIPIYMANFVLMYGTGVVMADAHDQRDFEFARKFDIPLKFVISDDGAPHDPKDATAAHLEDGILFNSGKFSGMHCTEALPKMRDWVEKEGMGKKTTNYRLRDWLISRQRYWGAPIPIVYDPEGQAHPVPEEHLPWLLPTDVEFKPTGTSPLAESKEFVERTEKIFGKGWRPDVDTMDTFVCSSYYYLRYLAEGSQTELVPKDTEKKWMPVDMYIGGAEHACMHLLYARFINMALKDFGYVSHEEPFKRLIHQGVITNAGAKMSKSKGNVVSPDEFVNTYGADVFRMYLMFMGPFTEGGDWSDRGITGIARFVDKVWNYSQQATIEKAEGSHPDNTSSGTKHIPDMRPMFHKTIKKTSEAMEDMRFNVVISSLMEGFNELSSESTVGEAELKAFVQLMAPLAPHFAEEIWHNVLGETTSIFDSVWPTYDKEKIIDDEIELVVQVNGKVRGKITVPLNNDEVQNKKIAREIDNVKIHLEGKEIVKEIYVPNKLVNIVIR